jgi:2-polyprenyl-3-methyl-5-hydroxy-6-metoxy-1,4-benzoquinol methylase
MSRWSNFYQSRINSTYQDYFEQKYFPLLDFVKNFTTVREEGIGIGSISKFLLKQNINVSGFDLCPEMLQLCKENNPKLNCYQGDIFSSLHEQVDIVVSHGVLEHFSDEDIKRILNRYKWNKQPNVHYVPLDGYKIPSFGDERLLSWKHWVRTFNPTSYEVVENKDLYLYFD